MTEKKRKRHEDGGGRPKKKAAISASPWGNVRVEFVDDPGALGPVLGMTTRDMQESTRLRY